MNDRTSDQLKKRSTRQREGGLGVTRRKVAETLSGTEITGRQSK